MSLPFNYSINGVVVTWVVAIDPPGVRFPLNAMHEPMISVFHFRNTARARAGRHFFSTLLDWLCYSVHETDRVSVKAITS